MMRALRRAAMASRTAILHGFPAGLKGSPDVLVVRAADGGDVFAMHRAGRFGAQVSAVREAVIEARAGAAPPYRSKRSPASRTMPRQKAMPSATALRASSVELPTGSMDSARSLSRMSGA